MSASGGIELPPWVHKPSRPISAGMDALDAVQASFSLSGVSAGASAQPPMQSPPRGQSLSPTLSPARVLPSPGYVGPPPDLDRMRRHFGASSVWGVPPPPAIAMLDPAIAPSLISTQLGRSVDSPTGGALGPKGGATAIEAAPTVTVASEVPPDNADASSVL